MEFPDNHEARKLLGEKLKSTPGFGSIIELIDSLLAEGGCPWDRTRTVRECPKYLAGELEEVFNAIENDDNVNLEEELGDLLFMVAFTAKLGEKEGRMTLEGMFERILGKMVYRHPHVFGGEMEAETPDQVLDNWNELKKAEKGTIDREE